MSAGSARIAADIVKGARPGLDLSGMMVTDRRF
jgi:hypothetical protein